MYKNIAFMYEGNKFVTLFNGSDYLRTAAVKPGGNYADFVKVLTDRGIHNAYKNATGCGPRDLPTVEPTSISEDGTNISFKGTYADSNNNMHQVEVTPTDIIIDNESAYGTTTTEAPAAEEEKPAETEVKEEKTEEKPAEVKEEKPAEAEVKEEKPAEAEKPEEPAVEEKAEESVAEEKTEDKPEEPAVEEKIEEPAEVKEEKSEEPAEVKKEKIEEPAPSPSMSAGYQEEPVAPEVTEERNLKTLSEITKENGAAHKKACAKAYVTVGAEVKKTPPVKRPVVIGKRVSSSGCYFGGGASIHTKDASTPAPTSTSTVQPQVTKEEKKEASTEVELPKMKRTTPVRVEMKEENEPKFEAKRPVVEPSVPTTPTFSKPYSYSRHEDKHADAEPFYKADRKAREQKNDLFDAYEATQIVDDADKEAMKNNTAIKETVLKELAPEVANVIDQIPAILFNDITEFMGHEVDQEALASLGNVYCIDERWHAGPYGWYCVDVVSSSSRYFYNAQQNISVSIPIGQVKAWKRAITI